MKRLQIDHAVNIKTIFCDIDGCIFQHHGDMAAILANPCELLPGVLESFKQWAYKGYTVILITGRPESLRILTEQQIRDAGLFFHTLIMGLPRGQRVVINDVKPEIANELCHESHNLEFTGSSAACINLIRNRGLENVNI